LRLRWSETDEKPRHSRAGAFDEVGDE
jgi:hypothetical protein